MTIQGSAPSSPDTGYSLLSGAPSSSERDISERVGEVAGLKLSSKTEYLGFSLSTYQNKSDPNFARFSNWGQLEQTLFNEQNQNSHLASGGGVDILTHEGRELICDQILAAKGNTLRFSVEWADIEPIQGTFDEVALDRYAEAAAYIKSKGITPIVTLDHFVEPLWFSQIDGFEREENIEAFIRFCCSVYHALSDHVEMFVTFNEPAVRATMGYVLGDFPPNRRAGFFAHGTVLNNLMAAHRRCYEALHELAVEKGKTVQVGLTHQALKFYPASCCNLLAILVCRIMTYLFHGRWMELVQEHQRYFDFFGVQYYTRPLIGGFPPNSTCEPDERMVESMNFRFDPSGIGEILDDVASYIPGVSLMVTETGTAGDGSLPEINKLRRKYYKHSIKATSAAQRRGIKIIGYLAWTLFGNFEWNHGYSASHDFGLVHRVKGGSEIKQTPAYKFLADVFTHTRGLLLLDSESDDAA